METEILKTETLPEAYAKVLTENAIAELHSNYGSLKIQGLQDKDGYEAVDKARKHVKKLRSNIENVRKELKADSLAYGRKVDDIAKELTAKIEPLEVYLTSAQSAIDDEKERLVKEEAERLQREENERLEGIKKAEEEKQKKIRAREQALNKTGAILNEGVYSLGSINFLETDIQCEEGAFHNVLRLFSVEAFKIKEAKDKEAADLKAKQAELEEIERKQKEERQAFEKEKEAIEVEKRRIEKEKQDMVNTAERIEREECLKKEAAEKAIAEQKEREARERAEADEKAAQAPDKEKLTVFINTLKQLEFPEMKSKRYKSKINTAKEALNNIINDLK